MKSSENKDEKTGQEKREEAHKIDSPEQLISIFLSQSVGLYIKQKNNEHIGISTNTEIKQWVVEDLTSLLDGMSDNYTPKDKSIIDELKSSIVKYVDVIDKNLSEARDDILRTQIQEKLKISDPKKIEQTLQTIDPILKDKALIQAGQESPYTRIDTASIKSKNTSWKKVAELFENIGAKKIADICHKQYNKVNARAMVKSIKQQMSQHNIKHEDEKTVPLLSQNHPTTKDSKTRAR